MATLDKLIGKKISGIAVNDDQSILVFNTDAGDVAYEGYGDCCSETWFADIVGIQSLIGATVASVEDIELDPSPAQDSRCRQEEDAFYGMKLVTDKGHADIIYRNSSNGYYGGSADLMSKIPDSSSFVKITDDWQAGQKKDDEPLTPKSNDQKLYDDGFADGRMIEREHCNNAVKQFWRTFFTRDWTMDDIDALLLRVKEGDRP